MQTRQLFVATSIRYINSLQMISGRSLCQNASSDAFVTTPIFYVNSFPHIGHLYTASLADAYSRFESLRGRQVYLSTGTDEHGMKIEKAAKAAGTTPAKHCNKVSKEFQRLCEEFSISHSVFVRTSDNSHVASVQAFWVEDERLAESDHIYKTNYEGWYSINDETFVPEVQTADSVDSKGQKIKVSTESGHPVEWCTEENYVFKLTKFIPQIKQWIINEKPIIPEKFNAIVHGWLDEGFSDLSVSRPSARLTWGVPVPGDPSQRVYVWLDALVNYLTAVGYPRENILWPPDVQVIGKDILKFHAVYWPAFLMASGLQLPGKILCHSHWTVDNVKMSKSIGNVVDPFVLQQKYGAEAVRFFLLSQGVPHSDGNFNEDKLVKVVNTALADTLGNLLTRCSSKALNPKQAWPGCLAEDFKRLSSIGLQLQEAAIELPALVEKAYEELNFYRGIEHIFAVLRLANAFVQEEKPWELVKKSSEDPQLLLMMALVMEVLRTAGIMLTPVIPLRVAFLLDRLNVPVHERKWINLRDFSWVANSDSKVLGGQPEVFFKRMKSQ